MLRRRHPIIITLTEKNTPSLSASAKDDQVTSLKRPFNKKAMEDKRQTELLKEAWEESGKVYGCRKLHDDLQDQDESCGPNRLARLTTMAGIKVQIDLKRRSSTYGGKPSIAVDNTLTVMTMPQPKTSSTA